MSKKLLWWGLLNIKPVVNGNEKSQRPYLPLMTRHNWLKNFLMHILIEQLKTQ